MDEKTLLRTRDFWTSIALIVASCFFLFQTAQIPFFDTRVAGVDSGDWYNSAALVPLCIFGALLVLSVALLAVAVWEGGAADAANADKLGISIDELSRVGCITLILFFYIFGLVPRVDFVLASGLLITCLIWGFHNGERVAMMLCTAAIGIAAVYAMVMHFPRSEWVKPHDDDWVTLVAFLLLTILMFVIERRRGRHLTRVTRLTPVIALLVPMILVCAMAFGFRQNVPNRTGLIFSQIEYHYYVSVRPLWKERR